MYFFFWCEIGCVVSKVIEVKECYGGINFFIVFSILVIEVLFRYMMFIEGSIGFFFKVIVFGMCRCYFKVCNSFCVIFVVNVDEVVVFGIRVDELF